MDTGLLFQVIVNGLVNGGIYAAVALALVLIFKSTGLINFAQGEMAMIGAFVAYVLAVEQGIWVWLSILLAMVIMAVAAALIERTLIRPFDPANHLPLVIITLGLFLIINAAAGFIWQFDPRSFPSVFPSEVADSFDLFGARIRYDRIGIPVVALAVIGLLYIMLNKTKVGLAFRAVSSNLESSELVGIHVGRTLQFGWAIAAAIGTLGATLVAPIIFLQPNMMAGLLIYSFAAATLGGLDSIGGAMLGGLIIGIAEAVVVEYVKFIGSELSLTAAIVVILAVLLVRPAGLFGTKAVERV